jgi:squalene-hopene/tetraprenyl-beta-curcumene cyclase
MQAKQGEMGMSQLKTMRLCIWCALALSAMCAAAVRGAEPAQFDAALYEKSVGKAIQYLQAAQAQDGSYSSQAGPAVTALVTTGLLRSGRTADDPQVAKSLKYLEKFVNSDGSVSKADSTHKNYETCVAILCFTEANKDGRYDKLLKGAEKYVKTEQWDEGEDKDKADVAFGGAGYGSKKRPDLSNTSFLMDALKATGNGPDDEAVQKALVFISRCQNLETEHNTTQFSAKNPDGGFYYTIAAGGQSMAGTTAEGGLRSYGSMTYAGLKSMIYAGVNPEDPRVKAAYEWIQKHYTLQENPGMEQAGVYYYYHTFAKALDALDTDVIEDANGKSHNWRNELVTELARRQRPDGSWINENVRWMEGDANLVTGYALLTLTHCRPAKSGK